MLIAIKLVNVASFAFIEVFRAAYVLFFVDSIGNAIYSSDNGQFFHDIQYQERRQCPLKMSCDSGVGVPFDFHGSLKMKVAV